MASSGGSGDGSASSKNNDIPRGLINRSGSTPGRGGRLPSVKGARDLTLGGVQRKVFTPNINAIKKPKTKEEPKPAALSAGPAPKNAEGGKGRGRDKDGRGRGRGRGQREDRTIQLQSEFAHGPMGGTRASGWGGGGGGRGGGGGGGGSRDAESDAFAIKAIRRNEDTEEDKKLLDTLLRDDFVSDISFGDPSMTPINLPLLANMSQIKLEEKIEIKEEVMDVDETPLPLSQNTTFPAQTATSSKSQEIPPPPKTVRDIFNLHPKSDQGELILLQFPDTLPGLPTFDTEDDKPKDATTKNKEQEHPSLTMCQLKDCHEGFMGKIRIRKSGKAELVLGDNVMDIMPGIPINFHQELISIHTDDNPGQMVVLGPVEHKLILTPNYKNLLENT